jgi:hypothetical protein
MAVSRIVFMLFTYEGRLKKVRENRRITCLALPAGSITAVGGLGAGLMLSLGHDDLI